MPLKTAKHARLGRSHGDGLRVLITRYWPHGLTRGACDLWLPALAPSKALLGWLRTEAYGGHDLNPGSRAHRRRLAIFARRYAVELQTQRELIGDLRRRHRDGLTLSLLCTCHDPTHCHRTLLARVIRRGLPRRGGK